MTNIWVPKFKIIEHELVAPKLSVAGRFSFYKYKAENNKLVQAVEGSPNLIVDSGLELLGGNLPWGIGVVVGTGNTPPTVSDTSLGSYLAGTTTVQSALNKASARGGAPDYWVEGNITYRFAAGAAAGNLTEVGVVSSFTQSPLSYTLFSRALIVDESGNPVTITVNADEYLDVVYTLRFYPNLADTVNTLTYNSTTYTFTTRGNTVNSTSYIGPNGFSGKYFGTTWSLWGYAAPAANTPLTLGPVTGTFTNAGANSGLSGPYSAYVAGSKNLTANISATLNDYNFANGIGGFRYTSGSVNTNITQDFQTSVSPVIMKDSTKLLNLSLNIAFDRKV